MSLRHALLGLLADEPASGYDLARRFEGGGIGAYAWQAGHTGIYPELARLHEHGLIAVDATGPRGRKIYAITAAGRAELRRWVLASPEQPTVRNETVLRLFLAPALDPDDARAFMLSVAAEASTELERLRALMADRDATWGTAVLPFGRLAGEYGIRHYEAVLGWVDWSLERLARVAASPPAGGMPQQR